MLREVDEVFGLEFAELAVSAVLEFTAAELSSARIARYHDVSLLGEVLLPQEGGATPTVGHRVGARTAIDGHIHRVLFSGVKVLRQHLPAVELDACVVREGEKILLHGAMLGHGFTQCRVVLQGANDLAVSVAKREHRRRVGRAVGVDAVLEAVGKVVRMGAV